MSDDPKVEDEIKKDEAQVEEAEGDREPTRQEKVWANIDRIRAASESHPGLTWPLIADTLELLVGDRPEPRQESDSEERPKRTRKR